MKVKIHKMLAEPEIVTKNKTIKLPTLGKFVDHFPVPESGYFSKRNPAENRSVSLEPGAMSSTRDILDPI